MPASGPERAFCRSRRARSIAAAFFDSVRVTLRTPAERAIGVGEVDPVESAFTAVGGVIVA